MTLIPIDRFKRLAILSFTFGFIYLIWLILVADSFVGYIFVVLETFFFFLCFLFIVNHWKRKYILKGGPYNMRSIVDVFIPTKNEPLDILEETIISATNIQYAQLRIYILDDSDRKEVKALAEKYDCQYLVRPDRSEKRYKAANLNYSFAKSFGNFILTLDADNYVRPTIIDDLLGHFKDEKIGAVITRQRFRVDENDFNNDNTFYEYMEAGKNYDGCAVSVGSGVIYRREAIQKIGGFSEWNIVEDMFTSYELNCAGYKTIYINASYTDGEAPKDLKTIYKQRGTWAADSFRMWLWKAPLLNFRLNLYQRLHYFEIGYIYFISAFILPSVYVLNMYSMVANDPILHVGYWYLIFKLPAFWAQTNLYNNLSQGTASSRMWACLFPIFQIGFFKALLYKKPEYIVTKKRVKKTRNLWLASPQAIIIVCSFGSAVYHLSNYGITSLFLVNLFWIFIMMYWLYPAFPMALGFFSNNDRNKGS